MDIPTKYNITERVSEIVASLADVAENPIDRDLEPVPPFMGAAEPRLIVIGQDLTVRNAKSRSRITATLNLDKRGALTKYIMHICDALGMSLDNVYATNVFKYFYTTPPAETPEVLKAHLPANLVLLKEELAAHPGLPIVLLGEPVLQLLTGASNRVREFWGYTDGTFRAMEFEGHRTYPFPHQPSLRKQFYSSQLDAYLQFMNEERPL